MNLWTVYQEHRHCQIVRYYYRRLRSNKTGDDLYYGRLSGKLRYLFCYRHKVLLLSGKYALVRDRFFQVNVSDIDRLSHKHVELCGYGYVRHCL